MNDGPPEQISFHTGGTGVETSPPLTTGIVQRQPENEYTDQLTVTVEQTLPCPMTVVAIRTKMDIQP